MREFDSAQLPPIQVPQATAASSVEVAVGN